jgi:uncharacterized protein (DUF2141 family)
LKFKQLATPAALIAVALISVIVIPAAQAGYTSNLEVDLSNLKNTKGQVCLSVFSGPRGFPAGGKNSNLLTSRCVPATSVIVTFANLPLGNYAVAAYHDIAKAGRVTTNFMGIPNGGFGFSNNPTLRFGPASFSESSVFVSGTKTVVQIQMRYLN